MDDKDFLFNELPSIDNNQENKNEENVSQNLEQSHDIFNSLPIDNKEYNNIESKDLNVEKPITFDNNIQVETKEIEENKNTISDTEASEMFKVDEYTRMTKENKIDKEKMQALNNIENASYSKNDNYVNPAYRTRSNIKGIFKLIILILVVYGCYLLFKTVISSFETPITLNNVIKANDGASKSDVYAYTKALEDSLATYQLDHNIDNLDGAECTVKENDVLTCFKNGSSIDIELNIKGRRPTDVKAIIGLDNKLAYVKSLKIVFKDHEYTYENGEVR